MGYAGAASKVIFKVATKVDGKAVAAQDFIRSWGARSRLCFPLDKTFCRAYGHENIHAALLYGQLHEVLR